QADKEQIPIGELKNDGIHHLLRPSKLFLQFAVIHFNQRRSSVRTGVRHRATAQVLDEILQFRAGQRVIGLHRMAADGLGNRVLAQPRQVHLAPRRLQFVHEIEHKVAGIGGLYERRQRIEQKRALAEFAQPHAEPGERGQLFAQEIRVAGGQFNGLRQQQLLRRHGAVLLQPVQHLLEQYPFVRGVLVEQDESAVGFQHGIKFADDADEPERDVKQRRDAGRWELGDGRWGSGLRRGWRRDSAFALLRRDGGGRWSLRFVDRWF